MSDSSHTILRKARQILAGFFVSGLALSIAQAGDLGKLHYLQLCAKARRGDTAALVELVSRKIYPASEIAYIARGEIFVGMTEGGARCALGPAETSNQTHTADGISMQVVFPVERKIRYLYISNGIVTAWQE